MHLLLRQMQEKSIEDGDVYNEIFELKQLNDLQIASAPKFALGTAHAVYLVATALATIGWFWLIAWCALQLV